MAWRENLRRRRRSKIAQHFSAGLWAHRLSSPVGTTESRHLQPSLRDSFAFTVFPSVKTLGYSHFVPPGQSDPDWKLARAAQVLAFGNQ